MDTAPGGILALDLSTRTGWAYGADFAAPSHGVWVLGDGMSLGRRGSALAGQLEDTIALFQPRLVILEAPLPPQAQTAMHSARLQFGLAAIAEMICDERNVPVEEERADVVRKLVMGRTRVEKEAVVAWCQQQGWRPVEHNDADAMVLLRYRHLVGRMRVTAGAGTGMNLGRPAVK